MRKSRNVLQYSATRVSRATVRRQYLKWRRESKLAVRCDNSLCQFFVGDLEWNGKSLPLTLDHRSGNSYDNCPANLWLLCPNCDSQLATRGGKNRGRVRVSSGGFGLRDEAGKFHYVLFAETARFKLTGNDIRLKLTRRSKPAGA